MNNKQLIKIIKATYNRNTVVPVLEDVSLDGGTLTVSDLETFVTLPYPTGLKTLVPAKFFLSALDIMEAPQFSMKGEVCVLQEGVRTISCATDKWENYPKSWRQTTSEPYKKIGILREADMAHLWEALPFTSDDDLRPAMTGIHLDDLMAATDAHRLYFRPLSTPVKEPFILPKKTAKILLTIGGEWLIYRANTYLKDASGKVVMKKNPKTGKKEKQVAHHRVYFENREGVIVDVRPIEANYPDFRAVLPMGEAPVHYRDDAQRLLGELKNAARFCNRITMLGVLSLNGTAQLSGKDKDFNSGYQTLLSGTYQLDHAYWKEFQIGFNLNLLQEVIKALPKGEEVHLKMWTPNKGVLINDAYLLMPLMVSGNYE